ncbi:MAG: T9SS type A sorting domain-containing protein [Hymenobacter sp.]|nr:MAG: T9SS type A sorting domain-containing protein [Hymenobacter sp.]
MRTHYILILVINFIVWLNGPLAVAQITEPSKGGSVSVIRVTDTTMELKFGNDGTGQGRVLAIAATNGPSSVPLAAANNNFYVADSSYGKGSTLGKGYTVYTGSGHTITVTGLKPSTYYYVTNAEYNTDSTSIMYNTRGSSIIMSTRTTKVSTTPLPVTLTSFNGKVDGPNLATLRWTTASEYNTAYFALERSAEGNSFTEVGRVPAAGASSQSLAYQWADSQQLTQLTYYRLRQADNDGTVVYSSVVALSPNNTLSSRLLEVYPNPSAGQTIQLLLQGYSSEPVTLRLTDALGRTVLSQSLTPTDAHYSAPLSLRQALPSGTYVLTLASNGPPIQKRLIISE